MLSTFTVLSTPWFSSTFSVYNCPIILSPLISLLFGPHRMPLLSGNANGLSVVHTWSALPWMSVPILYLSIYQSAYNCPSLCCSTNIPSFLLYIMIHCTCSFVVYF